jgi:hypothetical protein
MDPPETGFTSMVELFLPKNRGEEENVKMRVLVNIQMKL